MPKAAAKDAPAAAGRCDRCGSPVQHSARQAGWCGWLRRRGLDKDSPVGVAFLEAVKQGKRYEEKQ